MRKSLAILIILSFGLALNAETSIRIGGNLSVFETSDTRLRPGFSFAFFCKQWKVYKDFGLGSELRLSRRSTYLKNKTFEVWGGGQTEDYFKYGNLSISKTSIDIPFFLYHKYRVNNRLLQFSLGYSFSIDICSSSDSETISLIPFSELSEEEKEHFKFDFENIGNRDITGPSGHHSLELGASLYISNKKCIHISFIRSYIDYFQHKYYEKYLDTFELGFRFILGP